MKAKKTRKSPTPAARKLDSNDKRHTITAEVSIEVAGEDTPTKYDKRRRRWAVAAVCALVALAASVLSCILAGLTLFTAAAAAASSVVFWICLINSGDTYPEEDKYCDYSDYWGA